MLEIYKIDSSSPVNYAAEELKKYLRMMMPDNGDVKIQYDPTAQRGFRLGLVGQFELGASVPSDSDDDFIYIDCDEQGGIISGLNPRSVLIAVYEYLRQNGCRFLYPGIDGEYIPLQNIRKVKYSHKPSCKFRGQATEGYISQSDLIDAIDFMPKLGLNTFMVEFKLPVGYYRKYYNHLHNEENFSPEYISNNQILSYKRCIECELQKRGIAFHDMGHGFTCEPFGINSSWRPADGCAMSLINEENKAFLPLISGERSIQKNFPIFTNFCMSNPTARAKVCDYVVSYIESHQNVDYLHVWLADGKNNHCECCDCVTKTPSDWYVILLNEIDEALSASGLDTRVAFISYVDTIFAPCTEKIKNPERFSLVFAPISRSYEIEEHRSRGNTKLREYERNKNEYPKSLDESLDYFSEWRNSFEGPKVGFEYHFWRHQGYYVSGLELARLVHEDVKYYKANGIDGVIEDGSQRSFFPNGLAFYAYARTLYDTSLTLEEIEEDYLSHAYGEDWREFRGYLKELSDVLSYSNIAQDAANKRQDLYYSPQTAERLKRISGVIKRGRKLISDHYNSPYRVRTVSVRLLDAHADFCEMLAEWMIAKAKGDDEASQTAFDKFRIESGKIELEFRKYYDHTLFFNEYVNAQKLKTPSDAPVLIIE